MRPVTTHLVDVWLGSGDGGESLLDHVRDLGQDVDLFDQTALSLRRAELVNDQLCRRSTLSVSSIPSPLDFHPGRGGVTGEGVLHRRQVFKARDVVWGDFAGFRVGGTAGDMSLADREDRYWIFGADKDGSDVNLCSARVRAVGAVCVLESAWCRARRRLNAR